MSSNFTGPHSISSSCVYEETSLLLKSFLGRVSGFGTWKLCESILNSVETDINEDASIFVR